MAGIVVGVDGSESSRQALAWAAAEAELHHEELLLVQSWNEPMFGGPGFSTLFLTAGTSVYAVETAVTGVAPGSR